MRIKQRIKQGVFVLAFVLCQVAGAATLTKEPASGKIFTDTGDKKPINSCPVIGLYNSDTMLPVIVDETGRLVINVTHSVLPDGAATSANQTNGQQRAQITNGSVNAEVESGSSDGVLASILGLVTKARSMVFNGTTWDRARSAGIGTNVPSTGISAEAVYGQFNEIDNIPDLTAGNFGLLQMTKRGTLYTTLFGPETKRTVAISQFNALKTAEITQLIGDNFQGNTLNPLLWTTTLANGGTVTVGGALAQLRTNTTANGSATIQTVGVARLMAGAPNSFFAGVRLGDAGVANNERRWGAWNATDGVYFKLSGTTFSACRIQTSVESCVASGSFNGGNSAVIDTNFHVYEIHYSSGTAMFLQDRKLLHNLTTTTTALADTIHFPIRYSNVNSGGSTTDASLFVRGSSIQRYGRRLGGPKYTYLNTAATTVLKTGPGTLHRVILVRDGATLGNAVTLYDNTSATGTVISTLTFASSVAQDFEYQLDFNNGLTVVIPSANYQMTVVWE